MSVFEIASLKNHRLDAELALQSGLPTLFCSDVVVPAECVLGDFHVVEDQNFMISSKLSRIMLSLCSFASLLNDMKSEGRPKLDPLSYMETLVVLLYRLLDNSPLVIEPSSVIGDGTRDMASHLAMLAFMTTLLPAYETGESTHILLAARLESAVGDLYTISSSHQDSELRLLLWILFIGGVSVWKAGVHRSLISETCGRLLLYDWPAIRLDLCRFPWIHALHDVRGQCLWEDSRCTGEEICTG